jgi:AcrR family transcriptional regulator
VKTARRASEPPRRTQKERREATIGKLVDATIESLLAVGYTRTTVKEICSRAGVSHGALFRFFPSVVDVVLAASEEVARRQIAEFERRFARAKGGADPLAVALLLVRETCRSPTNTVFYELLVAARTDRELKRALAPSMRRYYETIRAAARGVPGTEDFPDEVLEVLLFTVIHVFDGESLARIVLPQPELEDRRMALLEGLLELARASAHRASPSA